VAEPVESSAADNLWGQEMANSELTTTTITTTARRAALAERLWRAAELQAAEVEARLTAGPRPAAESERDAKTLAVLARTLRELAAADADATEIDDGQSDTPPAEDVEQLREQLYERLRSIGAARAAGQATGFREAAE
jgi:hypothetical protein